MSGDWTSVSWGPDHMRLGWRLATLCIWFLFVVWLGPALMRKRPPAALRPIILVYNAGLVLFSGWWLYKIITIPKLVPFLYREWYLCEGFKKEDASINRTIDYLNDLYCLSKVVELLDTVFFVLRKKQNQVTFLHVYHHTLMVFLSWYYVTTIRAGICVFVTIINTFVHVVMYIYYFLAAFGPSMQKYLFWKKYITTIQMVQFLIVMVYLGVLWLRSCDVQLMHIMSAAAITVSFLLLFFNFYQHSYKSKGVKARS